MNPMKYSARVRRSQTSIDLSRADASALWAANKILHDFQDLIRKLISTDSSCKESHVYSDSTEDIVTLYIFTPQQWREYSLYIRDAIKKELQQGMETHHDRNTT